MFASQKDEKAYLYYYFGDYNIEPTTNDVNILNLPFLLVETVIDLIKVIKNKKKKKKVDLKE